MYHIKDNMLKVFQTPSRPTLYLAARVMLTLFVFLQSKVILQKNKRSMGKRYLKKLGALPTD